METFDSIINRIPEHFISAMKVCDQEPSWHAEGDVFTHTRMVYDKVLESFKDNYLSDREKMILQYSAIFHDIGKPKTTDVVDGVIRSYGHSRLGYHICIELLQHLSFEDRMEIANIVKYHGKPNWSFESKDIEREVIEISMDCNIKLLTMFVECDILGRITDEDAKTDFLLNVEYFLTIAKELDCYDNSYKFHNEIVKYLYLVRRTHHYSDVPYIYTKSNVIMMSGVPGTGKDTYINNNLKDMFVISLDDIRVSMKIKPTDKKGQGKVIQTAKELAKVKLRKGEDFVWNATNISKQIRSQLIDLFDTYDAHITIIYIENNMSTVIKQNSKRESSVPKEVIEKLYRKLEIPSQREAHKVKIIVNV